MQVIEPNAALPAPRTWDVPPAGLAIPDTRRQVGATVASWSVPLSEDALRDVELCLSELMANALDHAKTPCRVTVRWTGERLRVEVGDGSQRPPIRIKDRGLGLSGRGLVLVDGLAHSWGWYPHGQGKVVWFECGPDQLISGDARLTVLVGAAQTISGSRAN